MMDGGSEGVRDVGESEVWEGGVREIVREGVRE